MLQISQTQLINFTAQKAGLLNPPPDLAAVVAAVLALPALDPAAPVLAAWTRNPAIALPQVRANELDAAGLLRGVFMRQELQLIPVERWLYYHAATQRQIRRSFNVVWITWQIERAEVEALGAQVLAALNDGPATIAALTARLPAGAVRPLEHTTRGGHRKETDSLRLALDWLSATGQIGCRPAAEAPFWAAPTHYERRDLAYPMLQNSTLPPEAEAQTEVVRWYLAAFGPATEADIDFWTGFGKGERARSTGQLFRELTQVQVAGLPGTMLVLKTQADALAATADDLLSGCHFLPADDPFLKAYRASRNRFIPDPKTQNRVFRPDGRVQPTILLDGKLIGTWQWLRDDAGSRLQLQPFAEVTLAQQARLETAAAELAALLDAELAG